MGFKMEVKSASATYTETHIESDYTYSNTVVKRLPNGSFSCEDVSSSMKIRLERNPGKTGVMIIGLGGNNGTTLTAGIIANRQNLSWRADRRGKHTANWYGSMMEVGTMKLGSDSATGEDIYVPLKSCVPLLAANDVVIGGWDLHHSNLADSMEEACVVSVDLQRQIRSEMEKMTPLKGVFQDGWIAGNQASRANWRKEGSLSKQLQEVRDDIRNFKVQNGLDKVIVFWSGNTEKFSKHEEGVHDSAQGLLEAIDRDHPEIAPSLIYCIASILEKCTFINGSPQNTFCEGALKLAENTGAFLAGNDLKTGQTKIKSVLADWLVSSGLKIQSIASYNHLGNNDGLNLNEDAQFRSKEISKSDVVTDAIRSNDLLYAKDENPDRLVVIKYMPFVGDSKRAMDEYVSELFLGGENTISIHNTCEDSLLAAPLMMDLIILAEFCERISYKTNNHEQYEKMYPILSLLSIFLKAPAAMQNAAVINAFQSQRAALTNFFRAVVGLKPDSHMRLQERYEIPSMSSHL